MIRRLLIAGLVLVLVGGTAAVVHRVAKKNRKCLFSCRDKSKPANAQSLCGPVKPPAPVDAVADERTIDLDAENEKVSKVLKSLEAQGLNVVYKAPFALDDDVTVHVKRVPVSAAAIAVLKAAGWKYELTAEKILIVFGR
ncbi:MAG: hypothetical protein HYY17_12510 [Planctomycetes bacterium]|nr:hypothetical protein [Planctomycetota bacterium]